MLLNIERGSQAVCQYCAVKPKNGHSIRQSAQCDGIRTGAISGVDALAIRQKNGAKERKKRDGNESS